VVNLIKIEIKLYKIRKIFYLRPPIQYSFYWTDFHETFSCLKETHVENHVSYFAQISYEV